jgi:hypothetical protein
MGNKIYDLLWTVAEQLPSLITLIGCMIFALVRWKRHPKVSLTIIISLGLLFLHGLFFAAVYDSVTDWFIKPTDYVNNPGVVEKVYLVLGLIYQTSLALPFAMLLAGIFMQRGPALERKR